MKKNKYIIFLSFLLLPLSFSCTDSILEKPIGSDLLVDSIFATRQKSLGAIAQAYANSLASGITLVNWDHNRVYGLRGGTLSHLSGEINAVKYNWEDGWMISHNGMTADDGSGIPRTDDGFEFNYKAIRHNYLVIENIDKVRDMGAPEKAQVKAEMKTLIAYRYSEMFKRYGGVPIVTQSLGSMDEIMIPRSTLQEVLDHIIQLCEEALPDLPNSHPNEFYGRATKGVALAIKAEALKFAARPLFNSTTPYMDLGENNKLISFGQYNPQRWTDAIQAAEAVITWAFANGHRIINTGYPLDDYGTACATPGNAEVLIAYKSQFNPGGNGNYYSPHGQSGGANGMSFNLLT